MVIREPLPVWLPAAAVIARRPQADAAIQTTDPLHARQALDRHGALRLAMTMGVTSSSPWLAP